MTNIDELVKALRGCAGQEYCESCSFDCGGFDTACIDNLETAAADAIETLQAHCNQARLDCAIAERNHMNTLERFLEAQERIDELQSELKPFQEAAAEYGIDAKTMLTLAKSQIKTAQENISIRAERDQARLDCAIAERNHMNTLARLLDAQERITELTAERDALLKAVEKPCVQERGD